MGRVRIRQLAGRKRRLDLKGRSGCLAPVTIGIEQRGTTNWAPQADQGVPFNLGGRPKPITFKFRWYDRFMFGSQAPLLDGKAQGDAQILFDELYEIVDAGEIVELQHEHRIMFGTLRDAECRMGRRGELRVEVTFEPQKVRPKRERRPSPEPESALERTRRIWGKVLSIVRTPATLTTEATDLLAEGVGNINSAFRSLDSTVENYRIAQRGVASLHKSFAHASLRMQRATFDVSGPGGATDKAACAQIQGDDASLWLDNALMAATLGQGCREIRALLLAERETQREGQDQSILTTHTAVAGENLRSLAAYYWGPEKVDLWKQIADFNNLEGARLTIGARIAIPYPRNA